MSRTLKEAAADILNRSRVDSPKDSMNRLGNTGSGLDGVQDLGGATNDNPQGLGVGTLAAKGTPRATPPGTQPDPDTEEEMHTEPENATELGTNDLGLDDAMNSGGKKKGLTSEGVDEELTEEEIEEARKARWNAMREKIKETHSCKEDIDAMFAGMDLSEDFINKATIIFESAVLSRAITVAESLEEEILEAAEEAIEETRNELEEQVDTYLNFVVENWVKENEIAIETGLRAEVVEDFISGLKTLFTEHYIDVPEEKADILEAQAQEIEELNNKVNEALNMNAELMKALTESKKEDILVSVCEGLTTTQVEKVRTLAEGVDFTTEGDYKKKLQVIRENYFAANKGENNKGSKSTIVEAVENSGPATVEETVESPFISRYLSVLDKTQK